MPFQAIVSVTMKEGYSDPEGEAAEKSLRDLGYRGIRRVRVGKVYTVTLEAPSQKDAEKLVDEVCRRLLANPVKDDYRFTVKEVKEAL